MLYIWRVTKTSVDNELTGVLTAEISTFVNIQEG